MMLKRCRIMSNLVLIAALLFLTHSVKVRIGREPESTRDPFEHAMALVTEGKPLAGLVVLDWDKGNDESLQQDLSHLRNLSILHLKVRVPDFRGNGVKLEFEADATAAIRQSEMSKHAPASQSRPVSVVLIPSKEFSCCRLSAWALFCAD